MKHRLAALVLTLVATTAYAQEEGAGDLEAQLAEQRARLDAMAAELEKLKAKSAEEPQAPPEPAADADSEPAADAPAGPAAAAGGSAVEGADTSWIDQVEFGKFYVADKDGEWKLRVKGRLMFDGRFVVERNRKDFNNTFQVRRGRIEFVGNLHEKIKFEFGLEFGRTSGADFRNAFIELDLLPEFKLRAGQMLLPYSDQRLTSSKFLNHPERTSLVASMVGQRDIGVMAHGTIAGVFDYAVGIYGGEGQNKKVDTDDDFDIATRFVLRPFGDWNTTLSINYIYTPPNHKKSGPSGVETVGNQFTQFINYQFADVNGDGVADPNFARGGRHRMGVGAKYSTGSFEVKAEANADYHQDVISVFSLAREDLLTWGWFADFTYVLTGEPIEQGHDGGRVSPEAPLYDSDSGKFGMGAIAASLRVEDQNADPVVLRRGFAVGTRNMRAVTATVHWYMWKNVRLSVSYQYSHFQNAIYDSRGRRLIDENAAYVRWGLFF